MTNLESLRRQREKIAKVQRIINDIYQECLKGDQEDAGRMMDAIGNAWNHLQMANNSLRRLEKEGDEV